MRRRACPTLFFFISGFRNSDDYFGATKLHMSRKPTKQGNRLLPFFLFDPAITILTFFFFGLCDKGGYQSVWREVLATSLPRRDKHCFHRIWFSFKMQSCTRTHDEEENESQEEVWGGLVERPCLISATFHHDLGARGEEGVCVCV